jgi:hypothetical protein
MKMLLRLRAAQEAAKHREPGGQKRVGYGVNEAFLFYYSEERMIVEGEWGRMMVGRIDVSVEGKLARK